VRSPLVYLAALVLWGGELGAQELTTGTLSGVVVEAGGTPVADVEVVLDGRVAARTGQRGEWRLAALPAGTTTLLFRRLGYAPRRSTIDVVANEERSSRVLLAPFALPIEDLVVTASRRPERLADAVVTTELVDRSTIEMTAAPDLAAVLTEQTGIQFAEGHPAGAGVMMQGLSSERVLILLDGQPLSGRLSGTFDLGRIPTSTVERVEVVKGPQSTLYGSEAMGGVVNIITRRPDAAVANVSAHFLYGGSGRRQGDVSLEGGIGGVRARLSGGRRQQDRVPGQADRAGAFAREDDGTLSVTWRASEQVNVEGSGLFVQERLRSKSGSLYQFADNTQIVARLSARRAVEERSLQGTLHFSSFENLARTSAFDRPIAGTGNTQTQRVLKGELLWHTPLVSTLSADLGIEGRSEYIASSDGRIAGGPRSLGTAEGYAQLDWRVGRLSVVPGARMSVSEQWGSHATPRMAMRYSVSGPLTVRGSASGGFRAPDFKELYLDFTNEPAGYAVSGNPSLRPESSTNLSVGADWNRPAAFARVQGFWNQLNDFIETRPDSSSSSLVRYTYGNVAEGKTWGIDAELGGVIGGLRLEVGYGWLRTEDGGTGKPLLGRPEHSARATMSYGATRGPRFSASAVYTGATPMERDSTGAVTSTREAFPRIDLRIAQRLMWGMELSGGVDNVFDARPEEWAGAVGRVGYVGVRWAVINGQRSIE
jgi:outer membrane receptor for ferrienterochelin and colicins